MGVGTPMAPALHPYSREVAAVSGQTKNDAYVKSRDGWRAGGPRDHVLSSAQYPRSKSRKCQTPPRRKIDGGGGGNPVHLLNLESRECSLWYIENQPRMTGVKTIPIGLPAMTQPDDVPFPPLTLRQRLWVLPIVASLRKLSRYLPDRC